jgi:hypothetical protein
MPGSEFLSAWIAVEFGVIVDEDKVLPLFFGGLGF